MMQGYNSPISIKDRRARGTRQSIGCILDNTFVNKGNPIVEERHLLTPSARMLDNVDSVAWYQVGVTKL